ncbi:MAG TPA: N-acetyltransferase [Noviherbaspirillum sp.]|jgi:putative acetyltransferase|uniref:GNAT family N-acetyltransferase n=1 Tax=Noviherbaspirillum sp. TaxID=1926288 RepID=UPI002F94DECC
MDIMIRPEVDGDAGAIAAVTEAAFLRAPHASGAEQHIVAALREAGALTLSLVAEAGGRIVAHLAVSPVAIADGSANWHGLGPVSVLPEHQGQRVGSRLVEAALAELQALGAAGCVVLGEPAFYRRFRFRPVPGLFLPGVPAEYFMALAFEAARPAGKVSYHAAFEVAE